MKYVSFAAAFVAASANDTAACGTVVCLFPPGKAHSVVPDNCSGEDEDELDDDIPNEWALDVAREELLDVGMVAELKVTAAGDEKAGLLENTFHVCLWDDDSEP